MKWLFSLLFLLFSFILISLIVPKSSSSGCCSQIVTHSPKIVYSGDDNRIVLIASMLDYPASKMDHYFYLSSFNVSPLSSFSSLSASLCVAAFSGTCTVQLQREETHANTPARPRPSMTMWVCAVCSALSGSVPLISLKPLLGFSLFLCLVLPFFYSLYCLPFVVEHVKWGVISTPQKSVLLLYSCFSIKQYLN